MDGADRANREVSCIQLWRDLQYRKEEREQGQILQEKSNDRNQGVHI